MLPVVVACGVEMLLTSVLMLVTTVVVSCVEAVSSVWVIVVFPGIDSCSASVNMQCQIYISGQPVVGNRNYMTCRREVISLLL